MKFIVCKVMGFLLFIFIDDDDDWTVSVFKNMIIVSVFYDFFTGSKKNRCGDVLWWWLNG